jgi:uncharacterized protein (TIGR01319 family)
MMMADERIGSILVVDCGTVMTKAMLLDRIGGEYRFVASGEVPTTCGSRSIDVTDGVRHAVERISEITGRRFFDEASRLISPQATDKRGVDAFAATVSASESLKMVLGGLVGNLSIASAKRAAAGTYSQVTAILDEGEEIGLADEERVRVIRAAEPDVVLLAGGIDGGAERPVLDTVKAATLACAMMDPETRPTLLYAGNSDLRRQVTEIVGEEAELRAVENIRPTLADEQLRDAQQELRTIFRQRKMEKLPGFATLTDWSPVPIAPTAQAFGQLVQYLWHLGDPEKGVLGIDVGGANTTVAAVFNGELQTTIRGDLGVAFGGERLLREQGLEAIDRWLPESMPYDDVRALLINKQMHPSSIPQVNRELQLEQAVVCAAICATLEIARPGWQPSGARRHADLTPLCDTILISGAALTRAPRPGQAALAVLNALQPIGVSTLVVDTYGLAPALGHVAAVKPLAAVEALDAGVFTNLATVVTPVGRGARLGDTVLSVRVSYEDGSELDVDVDYGDLEVLPLPLGQEAVLELSPKRGFDAGLGGEGKAGKRRVSGGLIGLIVDARGRPLPVPNEPERRREWMQRWLYDVGG